MHRYRCTEKEWKVTKACKNMLFNKRVKKETKLAGEMSRYKKLKKRKVEIEEVCGSGEGRFGRSLHVCGARWRV